jgi:hypothetical protein
MPLSEALCTNWKLDAFIGSIVPYSEELCLDAFQYEAVCIIFALILISG